MAAGIAARSAHFALHRMPFEADAQALFAERSEPCVGVVLPKRWAKRAVTRNTVKRQVHSVIEAAQLFPAAYVVRLRAAFNPAQFKSATSDLLKAAVRGELQQLFSQVRA